MKFDTALQAFLCFFDDELVDKIHFETNLYCTQKHKIGNITKEEIFVFLGINLIMSYHKLPSIRHYWMNADGMGVPLIRNAMTRDRFVFILGKIHLNDNQKNNPSNQDKLYKVRPIIEKLNTLFEEKRAPREFHSVDESMIRFKGRSSLKQYNPMKPITRGYKLWCIADNDGYVYKFDIYAGKKSREDDNGSENIDALGLGGAVVASLTEKLKGRNHKIFFDNFFLSIPLMEYLQGKTILACATIRSSRKNFPPMSEDKTLRRGDFDFRSTANAVTVYKWKDRRVVNFISNYHKATVTTVLRKEKDGSKKQIPCLQLVKDYNQNMGGVDKHDMLR